MLRRLGLRAGKLGLVTDAETGEPLPGVNAVIEGTAIGATTDVEGYYVILKVPPGEYWVRASFIGYASVVAEGVVALTPTTFYEVQLQRIASDYLTFMPRPRRGGITGPSEIVTCIR